MWTVEESAVYRCRCGGKMLSLVRRTEDGFFVEMERPLLCPYCAKATTIATAKLILAKYVTDVRIREALFDRIIGVILAVRGREIRVA